MHCLVEEGASLETRRAINSFHNFWVIGIDLSELVGKAKLVCPVVEGRAERNVLVVQEGVFFFVRYDSIRVC